MSDVVIDTDVASLLRKHRLPAELSRHLVGNRLWLTFVSVGELSAWQEVRGWGSNRRADLAEFLARLPVLPADRSVGELWGFITGHAQQRGRRRPANDSWIAACAISCLCYLRTEDTSPTSPVMTGCSYSTRISPGKIKYLDGSESRVIRAVPATVATWPKRWQPEAVAALEPYVGGDHIIEIWVGLPLDHVDHELRADHDPSRTGCGIPCIRDARVTASAVLGQLAAGQTIEQVLADYPYLERADSLPALEFAAAAAQERELPQPV